MIDFCHSDNNLLQIILRLMKRSILISLMIMTVLSAVSAQRTYWTTGSEMIFSFSDVSVDGVDRDTRLRFSMFYHTSSYINHDFTNELGAFYGLSLRNVGFITGNETIGSDNYDRVKRRSYSLGLPIGLKVGNIKSNIFFFAGGEYEMMFHYKEKRFQGKDKLKQTDWFSPKTNRFIPSVFLGISFPGGRTVTFKYYLEDFMNRSYLDPATGLRPYQNMDSRIFYVSFSRKLRYKEIVESVSRSTTISM